MRLFHHAILTVTLMAVSAPAYADLVDDADRLVRLWTRDGARVRRLPSLFVEHGQLKLVPTSSANDASSKTVSAQTTSSGDCLTVALVAPRFVDFTIESKEGLERREAVQRVMGAEQGEALDTGRRIESEGGAALMSRCGADRKELDWVLVQLLSPRAAIEVVVAESKKPMGDLKTIFPERVFGPVAPRGNPGRPIEPGPIGERIAKAERRARMEGAAHVGRVEMTASAMGTGEFGLRLREGCHRLDIMAEVPNVLPRRATDVDAEAHEADTGRLLDRDRADSPDARLDFCIGETAIVSVPFSGASGATKVVVSDAQWPIPITLPSYYGPRARAGFASALHRRNAPSPRDNTLVESIGVQGQTMVPMTLEPNRCYFAAVALIRGETRALRIATYLDDRTVRDEATAQSESAGIAFCSEVQESTTLWVTARGSTAWWALAVWPMD